jgi:hypothetical protein
MAKLSISTAWVETKDIIARESRLFVAVALALFVLPGLVLDVSVPSAAAGELPPPGPWIAVACIAVLVSLVGQLAVIRLAMGPHLTVGEAIRHGLRRLLPYVGAVLAWMLPLVVIGGLLLASSATPEEPSIGAALGMVALMVAGIFVAVRLILSSSVASAETGGPIAILRRSWSMTQGNWWRLFGFLLMFFIGAIALLIAVNSVFGLIAKMMFGDSGPLTLGSLLVAVVSQLLSGVISVGFFVMLARLYVQRRGLSSAGASVPTTGI